MSEDTENKQEVILHKKKSDEKSHSAVKKTAETNEKRKVVRIKAKHISTEKNEKPKTPHSAVKKTTAISSSEQKTPVKDIPVEKKQSTKDIEAEPKKKVEALQNKSEANKTVSNTKTVKATEPAKTSSKSSPKTRSAIVRRSPIVRQGSGSLDLGAKRPNVKQGNLADKPKRTYNDRNRSGFTGAQAREGYQRNNTGSQGGYNGSRPQQGGYNGSRPQQGGYNGSRPQQGGYNGSRPQQGGYNGSRPQQGGYNGSRPQQGGYNGSRPQRQGGYNGSRPQGQGGYNGSRPQGQGGYNGSRPQQGGYRPSGPGGQNNRRPGGFNRGGGFTPPPSTVPEKRTAGKKSFNKRSKQQYSRKRNETPEDRIFYQKKKQQDKINSVPSSIDIMETISVQELAKKMNLKASDIIGKLMTMGMMVTITESIDSDTATLVASEFNCTVHLVSLYDETVIESDAVIEADLVSRPPVVTIMGHVDHGKTKTLDAIRSTNVIATEFGGITQHIGAYQVDTPKGKITFLDTPGHEAFTMMRARGAAITDIVILVVAADDGVMPQTIEAIHHAKDAKVPIIVAVNKIDKPEANTDKVMTQLSEHGLTPEEWGGDTQFVKISALRKEGLDDLLDAILLQAELLELKASWNCHAEGKVVESKIDHGRGIVSTILVQNGTLRTGDPYVAGVYSGRVRAIFNDHGQKVNEATPSMPVEILGLEGMPDAGDPFQVTNNEKIARSISDKRQELKRFEVARAVKKVTLDNLYDTIDAGIVQELKVIIKSDVQGSAEALKQSLEKLSTKDIRLNVIHSSAGAINESDVVLASADSNAIIIGFNVRPTPKAKMLADQEKVDIRKYTVIYQAVDEITAAMEGMLSPDSKENVIGMLEVRDTFKVPKIGLIAGSYVTQGTVKRNASVNIIRDGIVINSNAKISSLKRFKDDAKSVDKGFECGIGIANWQDVKVGDQLEIIEFVEVARKLGETLVQEQARKDKESKKAEA